MALNFLALADKGIGTAAGLSPDPASRAILGVAKFVTGAASKIIQRKKERRVRKAEEAKATAALYSQYASQYDRMMGRVETVSGITSSPVKASAALINQQQAEEKAIETGSVIVPTEGPAKKMKSSFTLIIGIIAAVFLLPKFLKKGR